MTDIERTLRSMGISSAFDPDDENGKWAEANGEAIAPSADSAQAARRPRLPPIVVNPDELDEFVKRCVKERAKEKERKREREKERERERERERN